MKYIYIILFIAINISLSSQSSMESGDYYYSHKSYKGALPYYTSYYNEYPSAELALKIAKSYYNIRSFDKALEYANKSRKINEIPDSDKDWYTQLLIENKEYIKANDYIEKYLPKQSKMEFAKKIDSIKSWANHPVEFETINLKTNTKGNDGLMVKASHNYGWISSDYNSSTRELGFYDIFPVSIDEEDNRWKLLDTSTIPLSKFHDMATSYDAMSRKLYVTRNYEKNKKLKGNKEKISNLKILILDLDEAMKMTNTSEFSLNNEEYSVGHASINSTGDTMYFVSDMPGGQGGTDIYMTTLIGNEWSSPINLGDKINTSSNEMFPYIYNNELFFSSEGHVGFGGLDIYRSKVDKYGEFSTPENLGNGINSNYDDFGINYIKSDLSSGYFSSNREGGKGQDDIYFFKPKYVEPKKEKIYTSIAAKDNNTGFGIAGVDVKVFSPDHNMDTIFGVTNGNGQFFFEADKGVKYDVLVDKKGFFRQMAEDVEFTKDPYTMTMKKKELNMSFAINDIYYEFDRADIFPEAYVELDKLANLLNLNTDVIIELSSHTDSRGRDLYNMELSQKRADNVVRYLTSRGVSLTRMLARGYGESRPVNRCVNDVPCTEAEYAQNRRTEFKVVDLINSKTIASKSNIQQAIKVAALDPIEHPIASTSNNVIVANNYIDNQFDIPNSASYYTVQIAALFKPTNLTKYSSYKEPHVITEGTKYIVVSGKFDNMSQAKSYLNLVKTSVPGAYVLKIVNGRREFVR